MKPGKSLGYADLANMDQSLYNQIRDEVGQPLRGRALVALAVNICTWAAWASTGKFTPEELAWIYQIRTVHNTAKELLLFVGGKYETW